MRVFTETQRFNQWWLHLIISVPTIVFLAYACLRWYFYKKSTGNVGPEEYGEQILVIIIVLVAASLIFVFKLYLEIDEKGIAYQFFPIHLKPKNISWHGIEKCYTKKYNPLAESGGWGYKFALDGRRIMNIKGNQGIQIDLKNGKKYLFGTQKPEEAQKTIDRYFKNK